MMRKLLSKNQKKEKDLRQVSVKTKKEQTTLNKWRLNVKI